MSDFDSGTMVIISPKARRCVARGQAGWISSFTADGVKTNILLRNGGESVQVNTLYLLPASAGFRWPQGTRAEMSVYGEDHPQRIPTEAHFSESVQRDISDVRSGRQYAN